MCSGDTLAYNNTKLTLHYRCRPRTSNAVYHAVSLDSLTGIVCALSPIRTMVDEMLAAQSAWLPQYA